MAILVECHTNQKLTRVNLRWKETVTSSRRFSDLQKYLNMNSSPKNVLQGKIHLEMTPKKLHFELVGHNWKFDHEEYELRNYGVK